MKKILFAASALSLFAAPAMAQTAPDLYGNIGYTWSHLEFSDVLVAGDSYEADIGGVTARVGARLHQNFAVEAEGTVGLQDDTVRIGTTDVEVKEDYDIGVYAVAIAPLGPLELFARLGFGHTEAEARAAGISAEVDGKSWNYGIGAQYFTDGRNGVRGDWTRRDFTDGGNLDTFSVSYVRRF